MGDRPAPGLRGDRAAVSDVIGSLLMVGITVVSALGFGLILFAFDGPTDRLHADLELRTDPGSGGWGTGDETLEIVHLGGEDVPAQGITIRFTVGSTSYCFGAGAGCTALGSAFGDGALTIGEAWDSSTLNLDQDTAVDVQVVIVGEQNQLLAAGTVAGTSGGVSSCALDTAAPSGSFVHGDLRTSDRTAAYAVALVATDTCNDVNTTALPHLWYRVTPAMAGAPGTFSDLGAMAWDPLDGRFEISIPAPTTAFGWANAYGRTLEFNATGLKDTAPIANTGNVNTDTDVIQVVGTQSDAPDNHTLVAGAFTAAGPFSALATDNGANAALQEACKLNQPSAGPLSVQDLCGTVAGGSGVSGSTGPGALFEGDSQRSTHSGANSYIEVSGFDVAGVTGDIGGFTVFWDGSRQSGGTAPTLAIEVNFGPDYSATSTSWVSVGSFTPPTGEATSTFIVVAGGSAGGPWTADQVGNLHVRARVSNTSTRNVFTDDFHIRPTYSGQPTVWDLDAAFGWSGISGLGAGSAIRQLSLEYQVGSGESYTVAVFDGASWANCANPLNSATLATYTCDLTEAQVAQGPIVRIRGNPSSHLTTPNSLQMDYMHMLVVQ